MMALPNNCISVQICSDNSVIQRTLAFLENIAFYPCFTSGSSSSSSTSSSTAFSLRKASCDR